MADRSPIPVRFLRAPRPSTYLSLYAMATGDAHAWRQLETLHGRDALPDAMALDARELFTEAPDGAQITEHIHGESPNGAAVVFDGDDNGHKRNGGGARLVFKRSRSQDDAWSVLYPAMPRQETLDLQCGPAPVNGRPVISFCGRGNRPPERVRMLDAFARLSPAADVRLTRFESFQGGNAEDYLSELRASHFVLCPPGAGRYSYRLYETLAAGRVPIIPLTGHGVAPACLEHEAVIIRTDNPAFVLERWPEMANDWPAIHEQNRSAWLRNASPLGWLWHCAHEMRSRL